MAKAEALVWVIFHWSTLIQGAFANEGQYFIPAKPLVPAFFVFGDSLADPGNNNNLHTLAKANYLPYGKDFDTHMPTGRFCNGRTGIDVLAEFLGLPLVPPYNDPATKGERLLQGVNFASAATGILNQTGFEAGEVIPLSSQIEAFQKVKEEISGMLGPEASRNFFAQSFFYIVTGSDDIINGYYGFLPSELPSLYTPSEFEDLLISTLSSQIGFLYSLGARKIGVAGLAPLGCVPSQLSRYQSVGACVPFLQTTALSFNSALVSMVANLSARLPGLGVVSTQFFSMILDAVQNPPAYGFSNGNTACCGSDSFGSCTELNLCQNTQDYIWWDWFHPTDKMSRELMQAVFFNGPPFSIPVSVQQLVLS